MTATAHRPVAMAAVTPPMEAMTEILAEDLAAYAHEKSRTHVQLVTNALWPN